jgi:hypothetical protein
MCSVHLIRLLVRSLRMFVEDRPALIANGGSCGEGGGADILSARYAIMTLAQLSFLHERDEDLLAFIQPDLQVPSLLALFVASKKDIGDDARRQALSVIKRLATKPAKNNSLSDEHLSTQHQRRHVMLSYCWASSANPELVKELGHLLQQQGIDVWRDETGSSLVGPINDSTDETMALAVEASSVVVICVSQRFVSDVSSTSCFAPHLQVRRYKLSPNCRQEAA